MNSNTGILFVIALFCVWPAVVSVIAVTAYKRYTDGGWRAVLGGRQETK